ncbi:hypothetical protein [Rubrivirga sp. IMCC43871]|uniref:hypothetical protein n=1 Tax=Rubrivirga sp. IMCC43871 TaxID=3391575 RepID=UPI00398F9F26
MLRALIVALLLLPTSALAQREGLLEVGSPLSDLVRRQATAGRLPQGAGDALPLSAGEAIAMVDSLAAHGLAGLSRADRELVDRYRSRTPATLFGRRVPLGLFRDGVSAARAEGDGYAFEASPVVSLVAGPAARTAGDGLAYRSSRGARAAGHLGRLYFETRATENQRVPLVFARDPARATAPGLGFVKPLGDDGYDYLEATGAVGYRDRFVDVRLARDRNDWGAGTGTLFLSNQSAAYDHLRIAAAAGPVRYTMAVARLTTPDRDPRGNDTVLPSKYTAFHRFSVALGRVQFDAFEAVVFHDDTLRGNRRGLELGYLNPVIFFRPVESELGSGDNALLGAGLSVRGRGVRGYSQFILDEFRASTFFADAWTNKWGLLAGVHTVDLGLAGLETRAEYARMRPYLWGHRTESSAYVHYDDVLGHQAGPNAERATLALRYRPDVQTSASLSIARTRRGRDPDGVYVGADPRISYLTRRDDIAPTFVGVRQTGWDVHAVLSRELLPRLAIDLAGTFRSLDDAERGLTRNGAITVGLRWEIAALGLGE